MSRHRFSYRISVSVVTAIVLVVFVAGSALAAAVSAQKSYNGVTAKLVVGYTTTSCPNLSYQPTGYRINNFSIIYTRTSGSTSWVSGGNGKAGEAGEHCSTGNWVQRTKTHSHGATTTFPRSWQAITNWTTYVAPSGFAPEGGACYKSGIRRGAGTTTLKMQAALPGRSAPGC